MLERLGGHGLTDVPAEQVLDLAALAQAVDHPVEPGLHLADLAAVVDDQPDVEVVVADAGEGLADAVERLGHRPGRGDRGDEPGGEADDGQHGHGGEQDLVAVDEQHERDGEQRHARADRPGQQQAEPDARGAGPAVGDAVEHVGEQRPERPLDQQVAEGAGGDAAEQGALDHAGDRHERRPERGRRCRRRRTRPTTQNSSGRSAWRHGSRSTANRSATVGVRPSSAQPSCG